MLAPHLTCALLAQQTLIFLGQDIANQKPVVIYPRDGKDSRGGTYQILSTSHNGTSKVRLDIPKPAKMLDTETLLSLDAPQVYLSTAPYLTNGNWMLYQRPTRTTHWSSRSSHQLSRHFHTYVQMKLLW